MREKNKQIKGLFHGRNLGKENILVAIIGAILGDISGSQYEFHRPKDLDYKKCELFTENCYFTDDTVMTLAAKLAVKNDIPFADLQDL